MFSNLSYNVVLRVSIQIHRYLNPLMHIGIFDNEPITLGGQRCLKKVPWRLLQNIESQ